MAPRLPCGKIHRLHCGQQRAADLAAPGSSPPLLRLLRPPWLPCCPLTVPSTPSSLELRTYSPLGLNYPRKARPLASPRWPLLPRSLTFSLRVLFLHHPRENLQTVDHLLVCRLFPTGIAAPRGEMAGAYPLCRIPSAWKGAEHMVNTR